MQSEEHPAMPAIRQILADFAHDNRNASIWQLEASINAALSDQERAVEVKHSEWHRSDRPGGGSVMLYTLREEGRRRGEPVMTNDVMINIDRGTGSSTDIEPIVQCIRSALVDVTVEPGIPTANCCVCRRIIDTREKSEGGDDFGDETEPGKWTCSVQCYDAYVGFVPDEPASHREGEDSAEVVTLTRAEAGRIAQRLEFDASWDKCGDGYYSIKRQLGTIAATRSASATSAKGGAE